MIRCDGVRRFLWMVTITMSPAAPAATPLADGDFESGSLAGWSASSRLDGVAGVVTQGECFSDFDTTGIVFAGNHAGLIRGNADGDPDSAGMLTSAPFTAGIGVAFRALTERIEGARLPDMPVSFSVRILDAEAGTELAAVGLTTSVVSLAGACHERPANGAFTTHYVDTRRFSGRSVRIQFTQSPVVRRAGLFTLVDDVVRLDAEDSQVLPDRPRAVAGVSRSSSGRLRLDGSRSTEPSRMVLTHRWRVAGEAFERAGEFPCIDDLAPGRYQATLVVSNGLHVDADSIDFVIREPVPVDDESEADDDAGDAADPDGDLPKDIGLGVDSGGLLAEDCGDEGDAGETREAAEGAAEESRDFRHYNPAAWDGQGVAIVLCHWMNGMDACSLNGEPLALHPNQSLGRDIWGDYDGPPGQNGAIECTRGTERFVFNVTATTELEYGTCRPGSGL